MHNYDFKSLSDYEFETLCGDLIQKELGITLERFAKGRDGGIDLRYARTNSTEIIIQCKHYVRSGYSKLLSNLKKEQDKIRSLNPQRYLIATSVELTPGNKNEIVALFPGFCKSPSDVFGANDLNNLLEKFPEIEKGHFKLWMSSVHVLEKIVHAQIFSESESELGRIHNRIAKYVICGCFKTALDLLAKNNVCVISGPPGVGKTTMAEIIIAHFLREDFEAIKVPTDIIDGRALFNPEKRQIFYYDDFLGRTSFIEKLGKNEDERLIRFIKDIQATKASKLVLTTREYILRHATSVCEAFKFANIDFYKVLLEIKDYSDFDKAKILYNHLYFSSLKKEILIEMSQEEKYLPIVQHHNYNPRIISYMTDIINLSDDKLASYSSHFLDNLNRPYQIWETAFRQHLKACSRDFLITLLSLSNPVKVEDSGGPGKLVKAISDKAAV